MKILALLIISLAFVGCKDHQDVHHSSKFQKMQEQHNHSHGPFAGKARSTVRSQIITKLQKNGEMILSGTISPMIDMDSVEVEWKIPEHIKVISGSERESLKLVPGKTDNRDITIDPSTLKPDDRIFFFVYQMKNGERTGSSAQYHHKPQGKAPNKRLRFKKLSDEKKRTIIQ